MADQEAATAPAQARGKRKTRVGVVVSDKMEKTVVVEVEDLRQHRLYGKTIRRTTKLKAHDEQNDCHVGDLVRVTETRPLSAAKRWQVAESGRVSMIETRSPTPAALASSWALTLLVRRMTLPYSGCFTRSSRVTTMVLSILSDTTRPSRTFRSPRCS
jgi:small subunit ribosomal protein S17